LINISKIIEKTMKFHQLFPISRCLSKIFLFGALIFGSALTGFGQTDPISAGTITDSLTIAQKTWTSEAIKPGLIWKKAHFENLFDSRQMVNYLEIDLDHPDVSVEFAGVSTGFKRTSEFVKEADALAGINATFFNTSTGGSVTLLKIDGQLIN